MAEASRSRLASLVALLVGLVVVGLLAGGLVGVAAGVLTDGTSLSLSDGSVQTEDPEGGIPPAAVAPDAPAQAPPAPGELPGPGGSEPPAGVVAAATLDPQGDGSENDDAASQAHDGDPSTAWTTETYTGPSFSGLKDGVGLRLDLGVPLSVRTVRVVAPEGTPITLYRADSAASDLSGYTRVGDGTVAGDAVDLPAGSTGRFWLLWLTDAVETDGGYAGSVQEVTFLRVSGNARAVSDAADLSPEQQWWWCRRHERAEQGSGCAHADRMGPYASRLGRGGLAGPGEGTHRGVGRRGRGVARRRLVPRLLRPGHRRRALRSGS